MTHTLTTKALSAALAIVATATSFGGIANAKTYEFEYAPVELENAEGRAALEDRIADFARHACASSSPYRTPKMKRACREDMAAQLETQIWGNEG
jgi:UrcA family protein